MRQKCPALFQSLPQRKIFLEAVFAPSKRIFFLHPPPPSPVKYISSD